jgi:hypothetical protein
MNLIEMVDKHLENPYNVHAETHRGYFHPSQASCSIKNEYGENTIIGSCLRAVYWSHKGISKTNPMTARSARICGYGKNVERFEVEQYKEMGIWRGNNVKFFYPKYNISGEADCIVWDEKAKALHGVELKSGYDYKFRSQVLGTPTRPGKPKFEHLLQTMIYVDYFKFPFTIVYIDRGNAARGQYEITLNSDGTPNINNKKLSNGISIPRAMSRFKELSDLLNDGTVPKRDFQLKYSKEKLDMLNESNRLNKKNSEEFEKNNDVDVGDWQCSYCDYKDYCWNGDGKNE